MTFLIVYKLPAVLVFARANTMLFCNNKFAVDEPVTNHDGLVGSLVKGKSLSEKLPPSVM